MTVPGYATDASSSRPTGPKPTSTTRTVRFVEVDVDTTAYEQSHIPGAVGWNWTSQLADGIRRDIATQRGVQRSCSARAASGPTRRSCCTATTTTGSPRGPTGSSSCTATTTSGSSTAAASSGSTTACRCRPTCPSIAATGYQLPEPDFALRAFRDDILPRHRRRGAHARGRPLPGRVQRRGHRPSRHERDRPAGRPHPGRRVDPVGPDGPRGRHVQERATSSPTSTRPRASRPTRTSSPTAGSASARRTRGSCSTSCSATRASATTTARGPSGAAWSACRSRSRSPSPPVPNRHRSPRRSCTDAPSRASPSQPAARLSIDDGAPGSSARRDGIDPGPALRRAMAVSPSAAWARAATRAGLTARRASPDALRASRVGQEAGRVDEVVGARHELVAVGDPEARLEQRPQHRVRARDDGTTARPGRRGAAPASAGRPGPRPGG